MSFATPKHKAAASQNLGERKLDWEMQKKLHEQATSWNGFPARDGKGTATEVYDLGYVYDPSQTPLLYEKDGPRQQKVCVFK